MNWERMAALGHTYPRRYDGGFDIPAYFVANARPGEQSADTHFCSVTDDPIGKDCWQKISAQIKV